MGKKRPTKRRSSEAEDSDGDDDFAGGEEQGGRGNKDGSGRKESKNKHKKNKSEQIDSGGRGGSWLTIPSQGDFEAVSSTFVKNIWQGPPGEESPSEDLKQLRKHLGVLVKGNVGACPPPLTSLHDPHTPPFFRKYCQEAGISTPSSVQMQGWPAILCGGNVLAISPTGTLTFQLMHPVQSESLMSTDFTMRTHNLCR